MGKLPIGILRHSAGVPVCLIAGKVSDRQELLRAGFAHVEPINPPGLPLEEAMKKTVAEENIRRFLSNFAGFLESAEKCRKKYKIMVYKPRLSC